MKSWEPFRDKCPFCNSPNLEYGLMEPADEQIKQDAHCKDCGQDFKIWTKTDWEVEMVDKKV